MIFCRIFEVSAWAMQVICVSVRDRIDNTMNYVNRLFHDIIQCGYNWSVCIKYTFDRNFHTFYLSLWPSHTKMNWIHRKLQKKHRKIITNNAQMDNGQCKIITIAWHCTFLQFWSYCKSVSDFLFNIYCYGNINKIDFVHLISPHSKNHYGGRWLSFANKKKCIKCIFFFWSETNREKWIR